MKPVLEARVLMKRYSAVTAVRDVGCTIGRGQVLGLLGPNGAGKSSIVKMITGLAEPTRGSILFHGVPIAGELAHFKDRLGYVPEAPDLYGFLTGWEYLDLVATMRRIDGRRFRE